jgi:hypothetical protein
VFDLRRASAVSNLKVIFRRLDALQAATVLREPRNHGGFMLVGALD